MFGSKLNSAMVAKSFLKSGILGSTLKSFSAGFHTTKSGSSLGEAIQYLRFKCYHDPNHHLTYDKWAKIFAIEGNIKVGKGAFAEEFAKKLDLRLFPCASHYYHFESKTDIMTKEEIEFLIRPESPMMRMMNISPEKVYTEPNNWQNTGRYQQSMNRARFAQHIDAFCHLIATGQGAVVERCYDALPAFTQALSKMKWIGKDVAEYLYSLHTRCNQKILPPQVMIYLDVPPEQCLENIKEKGTPAEKHISLDFLRALEEAYHTKLFPKMRANGVNVIELDWSTPRPLDDVILDLDEMPTLLHPETKWKLKNRQYKDLLKINLDNNHFAARAHTFTPIEELWDPNWLQWAEEKYDSVTPWFRKGFNKELGDKHLWLKD